MNFESPTAHEETVICKQNHESDTNWQYSNNETKYNKNEYLFRGVYLSPCSYVKYIIA